jgi:hypothetical protein
MMGGKARSIWPVWYAGLLRKSVGSGRRYTYEPQVLPVV